MSPKEIMSPASHGERGREEASQLVRSREELVDDVEVIGKEKVIEKSLKS